MIVVSGEMLAIWSGMTAVELAMFVGRFGEEAVPANLPRRHQQLVEAHMLMEGERVRAMGRRERAGLRPVAITMKLRVTDILKVRSYSMADDALAAGLNPGRR